ncbi:MAG: hypothetical protein WDZ72_14265, partial [Cyclobacteriaceae bacterium]
RTLGGCTAAPIFAWIIIHTWKRIGHGIGKAAIKREQGMVLSRKRVYPANENREIWRTWTKGSKDPEICSHW